MPNSSGGNLFRPRRGLLALLALLFVAAAAAGGEEDIYTQLLRRYEVVNSTLQHALSEVESPPPVPAYPARLLSTGRNAEVTIGGEMRMAWVGSTSSYRDTAGGADQPHDSKAGDLAVNTARMTLDARAGKRWRAHIDVNLNGHYGPHTIGRVTNDTLPGGEAAYTKSRQTEFINEFYVELLKDGHSGTGLKAGVMKLPFGLSGKKDLLPQSYMDAPDLTGSYLAHPAAWDNGLRLPHASALLTPVTAIMLTHELRDIVRVEAALFQEREGAERHTYSAGGVRRDRAESNLPQSWQLGVSLLPLEGWELSMQFRNRHKRSRGLDYWADSPYRPDFAGNLASGASDPAWDAALGQWRDGASGESFGSTKDEQAFALGVAFELPGTAWSFFLEYAKGWNQGFNRHIRSEGVNAGASYRLTPRLTLNLQGEWLQVKDGSWMAASASGGWRRDARTNTLRRVMLGAEYELFRGMTLEGGWQYEHWTARSALAEARAARAGMVYVGSRFVF